MIKNMIIIISFSLINIDTGSENKAKAKQITAIQMIILQTIRREWSAELEFASAALRFPLFLDIRV